MWSSFRQPETTTYLPNCLLSLSPQPHLLNRLPEGTSAFSDALFVCLSELQKLKAELRLSRENGAHVWTQTETYATAAAVRLFRFSSSSVSAPLFSVRVTLQLATSIKVRDPINSRWLFAHPAHRRTQVVLLLM